jgi:hypothetical protein
MPVRQGLTQELQTVSNRLKQTQIKELNKEPKPCHNINVVGVKCKQIQY